MPSQDTIYTEMLFAIGQGAGGAALEEGAASYLEHRGYAWIVTSQPGRGTPQDSWSTIGDGILDRCLIVGRGTGPERNGKTRPYGAPGEFRTN